MWKILNRHRDNGADIWGNELSLGRSGVMMPNWSHGVCMTFMYLCSMEYVCYVYSMKYVYDICFQQGEYI